MATIVRRGSLPSTPHTEHYALPGVLSLEEIHGSYGFSGPWSRKLHVRRYPTEVKYRPERASFSFPRDSAPEDRPLEPYLIHTEAIPFAGDALTARQCLITGPHTSFSVLKPTSGFPPDTFFRNTERHEIFFVQRGTGSVHTEYGSLQFREFTYIIIPKATTYRIELSSSEAWLILFESAFPIDWPPHYLNSSGQAHLVSPVVETEVELPTLPSAKDEEGDFAIFQQHGQGRITKSILGHHPFDVVGWEGALYPFLFDVNNHHGIAREIHTAPPAHQTFQSGKVPDQGFSLCSFVPQVEGWHPRDVGAPYAHLNVDSDELMFFCNAAYGPRKGIVREGSLTFHPGGVPHSPHGKAAEKSLAHRGKPLDRLAVMLDTYFESLQLTTVGERWIDPDYTTSWWNARKIGDSESNISA